MVETGGNMSYTPWTEADERARRARRFLAEKRWNDAIAELQAAVALQPDRADWYFHIGRAFDELGRYDDAVQAYRTCLSIDDQHLHALNHQGVSLHQMGRINEAIGVFERLESVDPTFEPSYCNRIRCYTDLHDHQAAEEMFYTARLYRDHCPTCYFNIGLSLAARGLFDRAIFCWQKTIDLAGDHVEVRSRIAETLWQRGFYEQARRQYLAGLSIDPKHLPTLLQLISLLIDMHRLDEAEQKLDHAAVLSNMSAGVWFARSKLLIARRKQADARTALFRTLQLDPTFGGANLLLARLAMGDSDIILAKSHLRAELVLRPESSRVLLDLSNMLIDVGEVRPAIACLKRLTISEPQNIKAWQNLAVAECMRGKHENGILASMRAMTIDPGNIMVRHNLALAYMEIGEYSLARDELSHAIKLCPKDIRLRRLNFRLHLKMLWRFVIEGR